jgi:putative endonuclease
VRGRRLAFVEVKARARMSDAETSVGPRQSARIYAAAEAWIAGHPRFRDYERGFDLALVAPRCWPRYLADYLQPAIGARY